MSLLDEFDLDVRLHPPLITGSIEPEEEDDTSGLCNTVLEDCGGGGGAVVEEAAAVATPTLPVTPAAPVAARVAAGRRA